MLENNKNVHKRLLSFLIAVFSLIPFYSAFADKPHAWQMNLQVPASPVMEKITELHNLLLVIIFSIAIFVLFLLIFVVFRFREPRNPVPSKTTHNTPLEIVWTLFPVIILAVIAFPSFKLMYFMDKAVDAEMTVKVIGHQWYWTYEYPDHQVSFDSYMIKDADLKPGQMRLLEVDNQLIVPADTVVRILVTSEDVLHSWAIPSLGIKQDSVPGKLREIWVNVKKEGTYYGQCSELCGMDHGFMPIAVKAVDKETFNQWLNETKSKHASSAEPAPSTKVS